MSLEIKRHIVAQDWMRSPQVEKLFTALQGHVDADEPQALFVGGCVRNVLLGKDVEDYDVATPLAPEHVAEILEREGAKVIPTGIDHGTVTAVIDDMVFEITTLRKDEETDGRHAVVSFTESWVEDAERRDFTINTLLLDPSGNVYDPLHQGLEDLDARLVRFVGDPAARIEEDHLRILRFFRFSAIYGQEFDKNGLKACQRAASSIEKLSKERITQEFFKIIASDKPYDVLDVMFTHDVLSSFCFPDYDPEFFEHFCTFQSRYGLGALSSRLFVFANLNMANVKMMERLILFPKVFLKDMQAVQGALTLSDLSSEQAVKECVYRYGRSITAQALMIELVQDRVMNGYAPTALGIIQEWDIPDFPVSGNDLKAKGVPEGPEMGRELKRLEQEWIDGGFQSR
ncbi:MAG: CCA tRNA nucleotidyltransferase [Alcanivorax sp.]